jgi:alpha-L-arabinofuranosidase
MMNVLRGPRCSDVGFIQGILFACCLALCPAVSAATAQISVNATQVVRTVDDRQFGLNTAVWDNAFKNPETLPLLKAINIRTLRFPGGSTSDTYDWQTNKSYVAGTRTLNTWTWATSFDDFAQTAVALNAKVFITANYGSGTAQQAADWVTYSNVTKGYGFKYWEIGNENYGNWEEDIRTSKWDPVTYANEAKDYMAKMKAVDPTIKIGVVVVDGENSYADNNRTAVVNPRTSVSHKGWTPVMLARLKSLGVTPDFAVFHRYPYGPGSESDAGLLTGRSQSGTTWVEDAAELRAQLNDYLGTAEGPRVELVVTENNSVYSNPGKQTTSLVNSLFMADSLGQILQTEFNGFVWWGLRNSQEKANNNGTSLYGWRNYGDYGVIAPGNATETSVSAPYPTYHVMKLLQHFARGGDQIVNATSNNPLLAVYAAKRTNGTLSLLVINKNSTETTTANVTLNGFSPAPRAPWHSYGIPQDEAARTSTGFADVALSSLGGVGTTFSSSFAPYSVSVIQLYPANTPRSRIANLSVRATAGAGPQTLIVGFVVDGASGQLPIVLRALGPKLTDLGVRGAVTNPQLELHTRVSGVDVIAASNDNWSGNGGWEAVFQRLGAVPLVNGSLDAALVLDLDRKPYTAHVNVPAGNGVALAEVYDASDTITASTPRLVNIAGRAQVNTGDDVLIAGFVISGQGPKTVLIRGVGPLLSTLGVAGALASPKLELHQRINDQDTVIASNSGWGGNPDLSSVFVQVGATPWVNAASKDAALLVTLQPGVYTAVVSGEGATTGVALVEVYEVD